MMTQASVFVAVTCEIPERAQTAPIMNQTEVIK